VGEPQPAVITSISKVQPGSGKSADEGDSPFMMKVRWFVWPQDKLDIFEQQAMGSAIREVSIQAETDSLGIGSPMCEEKVELDETREVKG